MTDPHKKFNDVKARCRQQISDLLAGEGPLWDELNLLIEEHELTDHGTRETLIAHMVAHRAAIIAAHDPGGTFFGCDPSEILLMFTVWAVGTEMEESERRMMTEAINRLGMSLN
jgi:hypothetical protein